MTEARLVSLTVNGRQIRVAVEPGSMLIDLLREELALTGTKRGCDHGECGCCTVLLGGKPVLSCLLPTLEAEGASVVTIEGIGGETLHPVQQSMVDHGAIQCGFCTPSMVLNAVHLLETNGSPTRSEIRDCVSGTICRCTGYSAVERAVAAAAKSMGGESPGTR